jgi:predicted ATP-dependent serine protease
VVVPYVCTACRQESTEWSGRCRRCGVWNTLVALPLPNDGQAAPGQDNSPLPVSAVPYQGIASPFETV